MNKKNELKWWDYRVWLMLAMMVAAVFWLQLGAFYYHYTVQTVAVNEPIPPLFNYFTIESINANMVWWLAGFALYVILAVIVMIRFCHAIINNRSISSIEDDLLHRIPLFLDSVIFESNAEMGIYVYPDEVIVPKEIIQRADVESLAHNLASLLYLNFTEINNLTQLKRRTALHSLADLLLANCKPDRIADFVNALGGKEKEYLANMLDAALNIQSIDMQIKALIEQKDNCELRQAKVVSELAEFTDLANQLAEYSELRKGKSAVVKWFKSKVSKAKKTFWRNSE